MSKDLQGRGGWMGCWGRTTQVHTGMQSEAQHSWDIHEVGRRPLRLEQREGGREGPGCQEGSGLSSAGYREVKRCVMYLVGTSWSLVTEQTVQGAGRSRAVSWEAERSTGWEACQSGPGQSVPMF